MKAKTKSTLHSLQTECRQKPCRMWRPCCSTMSTVLLLLAFAATCLAQDSDPVAAKFQQRIKSPVRAWFQPPYIDAKPDLYPNMTMVTSLTDPALAERLTHRGVTALRWCYGPNSPWSEGKASYYAQQAAPFVQEGEFRFAGVGIDEWDTGSVHYPKEKDLAAAGFRTARHQWPDSIMIAYVTMPDETFIELIKDHTLDLAIIEGYSFIPDVGGLTMDGICQRCDVMKMAGLLDRTIVCLGFVSAAPDKQGRCMTIENLEQQMREIKMRYPEMPGIALYGFKDENPETLKLIRQADALAAELYPTFTNRDR